MLFWMNGLKNYILLTADTTDTDWDKNQKVLKGILEMYSTYRRRSRLESQRTLSSKLSRTNGTNSNASMGVWVLCSPSISGSP